MIIQRTKIAFQKFLSFLGLKIVRTQTFDEKKISVRSKKVPRLERQLVDKALRHYIQDAQCLTNEDHYKSFRQARGYLSNQRMAEQRAIVDIALESSVTFEKKRVLDVGCGLGYLLGYIESIANPAELIGYDPSFKTILCGPKLCATGRFENRILSSDEEVSADIIFLTQVLEHLESPHEMLLMLNSKLAKPGVMVLSVPNGRNDGLECGRYMLDRSAYTGHINFWSHNSFKSFIQKSLPHCDVEVKVLDYFQLVAVVKIHK